MEYEILGANHDIAFVKGKGILLEDTPSALDFIGTVHYETGCHKIILHKERVAERFFSLSTGLAGEILQKFINYKTKIALLGDYSGYTSKPLKDFIYESNSGRDIFFIQSLEEAVEKLSRAN